MDIREEIIKSVVGALVDRVEQSAINTVEDVLTLTLKQYEVTERCTDIAVIDTSTQKAIRRFVATKRTEGIAESTITRYADEMRKLNDFFHDKPIDEYTTYDLRYYLSYRRERTERKLSNRTLDGMRRCFSSVFTWLHNEGIISKNPCAALAKIKYTEKVRKPYSDIELEKLRKVCVNIRDLALVDFLQSTGCRVSEVANLKISDVDFENSQVKVLGKGNKERIVYLTPVARMNLMEYLETRKDDTEALFEGRGSEQLKKNAIEALIKRLGKIAGVKNAHPHRFRRTLATNLITRGMPIQEVATILGHADLKTTMIYCYISQVNVKASFVKYAV